MASSKKAEAVGLALSGAMYGLWLGIVGFILAGAGHGWVTGIWSGTAIFVLPVFGVAVAYRKDMLGRVLMLFAFLMAIGLDGMLVSSAATEGTHYLYKLWDDPFGLALWLFWLGLWIAWQFALLVVVVHGRRD